ncbi:MAG: 50S ribosomal protein L18 [Candidatus Bathyarchaeia archaeon]
MAKGPSYRVPFRRRREGRTNYGLRRALLLSGRLRLVIRKSLNHIRLQVVEARLGGDHVLVAATSEELRSRFGWSISCGNIPAAYLTGLLCGLKAKAKGIEGAVLDVGLHKPTRGSRIFAALKGVLNSGVKVNCDENLLPGDEVIAGERIKNYAELLLTNSELYKAKFSGYLLKGIPPEKITEHFSEVKDRILSSFNVK